VSSVGARKEDDVSDYIYLDNNATTRPLPCVVEAVTDALGAGYGNPSSIHGVGEAARRQVDEARSRVAALLGARETEILFTSCATESINTALRGAVESARTETKRVIISSVEHEAVHDVASWLKARGAEIVIVPVDSTGRINIEVLGAELAKGATIVSVMLANNETGVITPLSEITTLANEHGVPVHLDAVQAVGKLPLSVSELDVDLLSLSGHKFHAPKGVGVLYVRRGARFRPFVIGAGQEGGRRGGTENVPGILGLGAAAAHMGAGIDVRREHLANLTRIIESRLLAIDDVCLNGAPDNRVPGTVNVCFKGIEGAAVVLTAARDGVCLSAGSACAAAQYGGSHVLEAMGVPFEYLHGAVRVSCCETTTASEVERACDVISAAVTYLRAMDPTPARD